jgi:hypothetical protein
VNIFKKIKKEVGMKRFFVIALALLLAVPAISYAGSVTSRWDVTIGGYIKFDVGWMSQSQGIDYRVAAPAARTGVDSLTADYGNINWYSGETRLNFAIKGPDAWGAKTSAFLEGDFRGVAGAGPTSTGISAADAASFTAAQTAALNRALRQQNRSTGYFTLRHAFMTFDWGNTKLLMGHTWQPWGLIPSFNILAFSENHFMKGATRVPQVRITQNFTKEFFAQFAMAATNQTLWGTNGGTYVDDTNRALMPDTSLEFVYKTDKLGKIGPWMLQFGLGGMVGREKVTYQQPANTIGDKDITRWGASFWGYIPIIPEKNGNKTNALGFTWNAFTGQGLGAFLPAYPASPYNRPGDASSLFAGAYGPGLGTTNDPLTTIDPQYPVTSGMWAQLTYYWTDKWFSNALWGYQSNYTSQNYRRVNGTTPRNLQNFIFNIMYDPNPAIRLALEYTRITTAYGGWTATTEGKGKLDAVRFGAYYFF